MSTEHELLVEAAQHGTITLIKRDPARGMSRLLITVGNASRPLDVSDEYLRDSGLQRMVH